ncbi:MAG: glycosyltransferase [Gemmatimonadota bacterium]|nr:glycosyltransferase [Gemmatimonadota bacterium]
MVAAIEAMRVPVSLRSGSIESPGFRETLAPDHLATLTRCLQRPVPGPFIHVQHSTIDSFVPPHEESVYSIGRSMFETDSLPGHWVAGANALDELWVTGEFNAQTFRNAGVRVPLHIIPGGIDSQLFHPDVTPYAVPGVRGTVFLSVFEWRLRKGWDVLMRAWADAFSPDDDVTLVIRAYPIGNVDGRRNADILNERIDRYLADVCGRTRADVAPIVLIGERVPARDLPALYRMAHSFVLPTRGEGWGRPFMESMACGVPVIATNWSAHLAFLNADNGLLIDVDGLVPADATEVPVYAGQQWAQPSASHLSTLFRRVHADRAEARALGARARHDMVTEWPWSRVGTAINARLAKIDRGIQLARTPSSPTKARTTPKDGVVIEGGSGDPMRPHSNASEWLLALKARGGMPYSWQTRQRGARPAWSAPEIDAWQRANVRLPDVVAHVTVLDHETAETAPLAPIHGVWVVDTGSVVTDHVPPYLVTTLRDRADVIVVPHDTARSAVLAIGADATRVVVLESPVDTSRFTPTGAPYGRPATAATRFLLFGGHQTEEAVTRVVAAYDRAFTADDDVLLHLVLPAGPDSPWSARAIADAATNRRHPKLPALWIDRSLIRTDEMPSLYRSSSVLLAVDTAWGRGRTVREAMACGVPVIAADTHHSRQLLDADAGWFVPACDGTSMEADAWRSALVRAMRSANDPVARTVRSQAARQQAMRRAPAETARAAMAGAVTEWSARTPRTHRAAPISAPGPTITPFVLESPRTVVVLAHADWHNGLAPSIARSFAAACGTDDDVTLAICLDPAQQVSADLATEQLRTAMRLTGRDEAQWPDLLLVDARLDGETLQQLRAAADVVVAVRDPAAATAARAAGCAVIDSLHPSTWESIIVHKDSQTHHSTPSA